MVEANGKYVGIWDSDVKVDKTSLPNQIYGTNASGAQTVYNKSDLGIPTIVVGQGQYSEVFNYSTATTQSNATTGNYSHVEGYQTRIAGGTGTTSIGSHVEGFGNQLLQNYSQFKSDGTHIEGYSNQFLSTTPALVQMLGMHIEGYQNNYYGSQDYFNASSNGAHVEGIDNFTHGEGSHVQGKHCIKPTKLTVDRYAHVVGNGTTPNNRSNAHTLDWSGNAWYQGLIRVGGTSWDDAPDTVATQEWVIENAPGIKPVTTSNIVYATDGLGAQTQLKYTSGTTALSLVQRLANGNINVPTAPADDNSAVSKKYVDDTEDVLQGQIDTLDQAMKKYLPLTGGILTGGLTAPNFAFSPAPQEVTAPKYLVGMANGSGSSWAPVSIENLKATLGGQQLYAHHIKMWWANN